MNKTCIAIIPARSGSKSFKDKNISMLNGSHLFSHSIRFAKKLNFIRQVYFLTDSSKYAKLAEKYGANVPYLRGEKNSDDLSMEEDVLFEFKNKMFIDNDINILWLRPTHPLRDLEVFQKSFHRFIDEKLDSVCIVTEAESRIYKEKNGFLYPLNDKLLKKSMWRRQDVEKSYKLFHGEFFKLPKNYDKSFLGNKIGFEILDSLCSVDIDNEIDLSYLNYRIKKTNIYARFLH